MDYELFNDKAQRKRRAYYSLFCNIVSYEKRETMFAVKERFAPIYWKVANFSGGKAF